MATCLEGQPVNAVRVAMVDWSMVCLVTLSCPAFCCRSMYSGPLTPSSNTSLSPASSPVNETAFEKPSLPSATDWSEFLSASTSEKVENEFAQLTLSDHEQRELYEAAKLVRTVFRKYKVRGGGILHLGGGGYSSHLAAVLCLPLDWDHS